MDPITILELVGFLGGLLGSQGQKDKPDLKDPDSGEWLPLHYMQHCRAEAEDLESVYKDGHTICHNLTGVPVGRWSPGLKRIQPVVGFTKQGLPVYEEVPVLHPVWTTFRACPSHLGSPGSEGQTVGYRGHNIMSDMVPELVQYRRGEKLAAFLGNYGPLTAPRTVPPSTGSGAGGAVGLPGGMLLLGAGVMAAAGLWVPAGITAGLALLSGGMPGLFSAGGGGGSAGGPSGTRGASGAGRPAGSGRSRS